MNRTNRILTAILGIQIVLAVLVFLPRILPAGAASGPLFGALDAKDVTALTVQDKDGNRVELARQGEVWVVPAVDDYPADKAKIDTFLEGIAGLKTNPLVTRTSASHKRLQVADDDFVRRVDLTLADGSSRTLFIGSSSGGGSHVRAGGQDEVYLAQELFSYDAGTAINNWIDTLYFSVAQDKMTGLKLENANGTLEFEKDASGNWTMKGLAAGEEFNANNLTTLLTRLSSLRMTSPLGKEAKSEYGLDQPTAVITLTANDESGSARTYTLRIGAKDAETNDYVVISSESPYYVRVAGFSVEDFVTRARQDFLTLPPTPTATPEITPTPEATPALEVTPTPQDTPQATP